ncbi:MAG: patatin-like phospholipase family protein [Elusimicrobia bacterium]|nr:patatin-like phospholipase family protein [Elusimicrobiota bacterium]
MRDFERPLGLALAGGGAHGAWQAGALRSLSAAGLSFDQVIGFSAGALTGVAYALDIEDELTARWSDTDGQRPLRFAPRLSPASLFSGESIWEAVRKTHDEAEARRRLRCELTVVSLRVPQREYDYARFTPSGAGGWDGPLAAKLVASCAIPGIFPPVTVAANGTPAQRLVDGGVPGREPLRFDALAGCRTVIALQMTRPEEVGRFHWWPWRRIDQMGRDVCHRQMVSGLDSLLSRADAPAVYRFYPSRTLEFSQLSFRTSRCAPAMEQGARDGRAFLEASEGFRIASPLGLPAVA